MSDVLIVFIAWFVGSAVWLLMQVAMHLLIVKTHEAYKNLRDMTIVAMLVCPVFAILFYFVSWIWSDDFSWVYVVVMPLITAWAIAVVLAGVHTAARMRGVLKPDSPK